MLEGLDPFSPTWSALKTWANERIVAELKNLEARGLPVADTEFARGRIDALRKLLTLTDPKPQPDQGIGGASDRY